MKKSNEILKQYWGFDKFRPLQEEIVDSVLYGHDTIAILPTGGGKSICFQVPGLAREGLTLVISPLIALMEDQVANLRSKGIAANLITSAMSYREIDITLDNARFGKMKFLYTSPERIKSELFRERFKTMPIALIVVDEAHCISEWGHDFRPAYREINTLREIHPETPMIAVTASATQRVQEDIIKQLALKNPNQFKGSLERTNLRYRVIASERKSEDILTFCKENIEHTGIVYCQTRRSVKHLVKLLRAHNLSAGFYHGGLSPDDRKFMLNHWMNNDLRIMVATNAFGMGIDKPNVRYVLHYEIPNNLEAYYQEAGRAGRDEQEAQAIAFWETNDIQTLKKQLEIQYPPIERIKHIYNCICNFLQIAIGSGEQERYSFDIHRFHNSFSIPITETYYALKILQNNGTLNFAENSFHPTKLKFAIGSSALYKFQVSHDSTATLITLLTRSYPGIFDQFIRIDEAEISKRLKITRAQLTEKLKYLEKYGVADIDFQSNLPQVILLTERLPEGYLKIDNSIYGNRKKIDSEKLSAIIRYLTPAKCRSQQIGEYFESTTKKCGKCDVCLTESTSNHTFDELIQIIPGLLPATIDQLKNELNISKEALQAALHHLILEETITCEDTIYSPINS